MDDKAKPGETGSLILEANPEESRRQKLRFEWRVALGIFWEPVGVGPSGCSWYHGHQSGIYDRRRLDEVFATLRRLEASEEAPSVFIHTAIFINGVHYALADGGYWR